jgi:pimeloyl-ACP methyl ester carboxylesterase
MHFPPDGRSGAIVLVHGAWVGEWSWQPILGPLAASGRAVHPVSLTGHGVRRHQAGPTVELADHVADLREVFTVHDLDQVTLVGHSYGGRVITKAYPELADRIRAMVYVDAHAPTATEPPPPAGRAALAEANGGMLPFHEAYRPTPALVGDVDWFMARTGMHSFACFDRPWQVELPDDLPKRYIHATDPADPRFAHYADAAVGRPGWTRFDLPGPHFIMMSHPDELARLILEA